MMINYLMKLLFIAFLMMLLSACGVYIGNLKQTPNPKLAVLKESYIYTRDRNTPFCDETFTYRALAGTYYPEFEDDNGVYFRGRFGAIQFEPLKVSCFKEVPKMTSFEWAGIYIPNNVSSPAKLYVYSGSKPPNYKSVVPDDIQPIKNISASAQVIDSNTNGVVPALILAIERESIQFLRF